MIIKYRLFQLQYIQKLKLTESKISINKLNFKIIRNHKRNSITRELMRIYLRTILNL